jgi:hypothetical protein
LFSAGKPYPVADCFEENFRPVRVSPDFYTVPTGNPQPHVEENADRKMPGSRKAFTGQGF